jgi:hypothetical protein
MVTVHLEHNCWSANDLLFARRLCRNEGFMPFTVRRTLLSPKSLLSSLVTYTVSF